MSFSERQVQTLDQPVGEVSGRRISRTRDGGHSGLVRLEVQHHPGHGADCQIQVIERPEDRRFVLLHVLVVGQRQALHHGVEGHEIAADRANLGAHQFSRIGIALLRHNRRAGGIGIRKADEAELGIRPDHHLLGQPRQMSRAKGGAGQGLKREITVPDTV